MATDLERLVVTIEANTSNIDKKLRELQATVDGTMTGVENRTKRMTDLVGGKFASLSRLTRQFTAGFAILSTIRFAENVVNDFDKIVEKARELKIAVDDNLVSAMHRSAEEGSKAWTQLQLSAAAYGDTIERIKAGAFDLGRAILSIPEAMSMSFADIQKRQQAQANNLLGQSIGSPFAPGMKFPAPDRTAADVLREAAAADAAAAKIAESVKKSAQAQLEINQINAAGTETMRQQILKERFEADAAAKEFELQSQIELNERIEDSINDRVKIELDAVDKIVKAEEDRARRQQEINDRLNERIVGDFAQTASDVILNSEKASDAVRGLARSIASALLQDTIKNSLSGVTLKGVGAFLGFAGGGRPPVGVPSVVGERGRELFVPDVPGTIYPNGSGVGGGSNYFDLRGAVVTQDLLDQMNAISRRNSTMATAQAIKQSDSRFASNYFKTLRDAA